MSPPAPPTSAQPRSRADPDAVAPSTQPRLPGGGRSQSVIARDAFAARRSRACSRRRSRGRTAQLQTGRRPRTPARPTAAPPAGFARSIARPRSCDRCRGAAEPRRRPSGMQRSACATRRVQRRRARETPRATVRSIAKARPMATLGPTSTPCGNGRAREGRARGDRDRGSGRG